MSERRVKVWDLPTRLFHWLLVATLIFQYASAEILENAIQWHFYSGYFCLGLILFRIVWGLVGSYYARFSQFVVPPQHAIAYLRAKNTKHYLGHNPAGAYSVILLLSLVLTQAVTGLFISDDIFSNAPYYDVLPKAWEDAANFIHHRGFNIILAAVALHVGAIVYYKIKHKQTLLSAMITGYKAIDSASALSNEEKPISANTNWLLFIFCIAVVAGTIYLIVEVFAPVSEGDYYDY